MSLKIFSQGIRACVLGALVSECKLRCIFRPEDCGEQFIEYEHTTTYNTPNPKPYIMS